MSRKSVAGIGAVAATLLLSSWFLSQWAPSADSTLAEAALTEASPGAAPNQAPQSKCAGSDGGRPAEVQRPEDHADASERELWSSRLSQAEELLANYRQATRYPPGSRPLAEQTDRAALEPVIERSRPLARLGEAPSPGSAQLLLSQDRVFLAGGDTAQFTISARSSEGAPLSITRVSASAAATPPAGDAQGQQPPVPVIFNDEGSEADRGAADGIWTGKLTPSTSPLHAYRGTIRVWVTVSVGSEVGEVFFDLVATGEVPARFLGPAREALESGSLAIYLPIEVFQPGRFRVVARADDAKGVPTALLTFDQTLGVGRGEVRLELFGRLMVDLQPTFPLTVRDLEGVRLLPGARPDREVMAPLRGVVHTTGTHSLAAFSDEEWASPQRSRHLERLRLDAEQARRELESRPP